MSVIIDDLRPTTETPVFNNNLGIFSPLLVAFVLVAAIGGCGGDKTSKPQSNDGFDRNAMLENWSKSVVGPTLSRFASQANNLAAATAELDRVAAAGGSDYQERMQAAQTQWRNAMNAWQVAELLQFGPAGERGKVTGGQSLRAKIYSWPSVSPCRVDERVFLQDYSGAAYFEAAPLAAYGLDALEYLLFQSATTNACNASSALNQGGAWNNLGEAEIVRRRAAYAKTVAEQLKKDAEQLDAAWAVSGGDFSTQWITAGKGSTAYDSAQMAVDEVYAAMLYLDPGTQDAKLGIPAGINAGCTKMTCPEALESPWAGTAKENIQNNLTGFKQLFTGDANYTGTPDEEQGPGFDEWLRALGADALADRMIKSIRDSEQAAAGLQGTLAEALVNNLDQVKALHAAVSLINDDLKGEFVSVLNLRLPGQGAGDND